MIKIDQHLFQARAKDGATGFSRCHTIADHQQVPQRFYSRSRLSQESGSGSGLQVNAGKDRVQGTGELIAQVKPTKNARGLEILVPEKVGTIALRRCRPLVIRNNDVAPLIAVGFTVERPHRVILPKRFDRHARFGTPT